MPVSYTFRKVPASEALKSYVEKKVESVLKHVSYHMDVQFILSVEKTLHCVEINCHAEHKDLFAVAKTKNLYESIDACVDKVKAQLKKEREKRKGHSAAHQVAKPVRALKIARDVAADLPHREKKLRRAR